MKRSNPPPPLTAFATSTLAVKVGRSFAVHFRYYRSQHRTTGCRVTHMIGVPLIILSLVFLPRRPRTAAKLQIAGWLLQAIGHYVFERNKPVLLEVHDTMTVWSALVFVFKLWKNFLQSGAIDPTGRGSS